MSPVTPELPRPTAARASATARHADRAIAELGVRWGVYTKVVGVVFPFLSGLGIAYFVNLESELDKLREWRAAVEATRFTSADAVALSNYWADTLRIHKDHDHPPKYVDTNDDRHDRELAALRAAIQKLHE